MDSTTITCSAASLAASPTEAALRHAWRSMTSPGCPDSFAAAMAHPVWAVCIRGAARSLQPVHWPATRRHPADATDRTPFHSRTPRAPHHQAVDIKRLAANDRDD